MRLRRSLALFSVLALSLAAAAEPGAALDPIASFPDNADLRSSLFSSLIGAPREAALAYGERVQKSAAGAVLVRAVKRADDFVVEFRAIPESGPLPTTRGSCLIQRSNAKGNYLVQAKIFLQDDPATFLRLYPNPKNGSTLADLVVYGALVEQGLAVQGMLYQVLIRPFPQLAESLGRAVDWAAVLPSAAFAAPAALPGSAPLRGLSASSSPESFLASETGCFEFPGLEPLPAGFSAERAEIGAKPSYAAFPPYLPGKGIPAAALKAALYLDSLSHPGRAYALYGEGFRALALPSCDEGGRFELALLGPEGEARDWEALFPEKKGGSARILVLPPA
ncbi:MAG TPA: hypothetical protein PLB91_13555 [Spirochaetales bacterium]|nr:hypothetical protein [Spirochaetales bacterium]HRY55590.1 hypothetical protein [Spirochaetia bacterium]